MKIQEGKYKCEWCKFEFEQQVGKWVSSDDKSRGKKNVSSQCICPKCSRYVSQKTKMERETKLSKGQRV